MERYLKIASVHFKFHITPHALIAFLLCTMAPLFMGVKNLDPLNTAKIIDLYLSLLGIILFVPVFLPDQDRDIRDLIRSKKEPLLVVHFIRILESCFLLCLFSILFLLYLKGGHCDFPFFPYFYATLANGLFLGGMGVFVYAIIDNLPVGYMIPILYYIVCYGAGKKYLGNFYLFSLMQGQIEHKIYLLFTGILLLVFGVMYRNRRHIL